MATARTRKGRSARGARASTGDSPFPEDEPRWPVREALNECRRCDLWRRATQGVPGQGAASAQLMLVGEQPGDEEDRLGAPFVGPAGRLLDKALEAVGVDRGEVFITNAVKHFKWERRGKRRLHKKPKAHEVAACHYWLTQEIGRVQPRVIVALGTTALYALTGSAITLTAAREQSLVHESGARIVATFHPSAVLRARDEDRETFFEQLCRELRGAVRLAAKGAD